MMTTEVTGESLFDACDAHSQTVHDYSVHSGASLEMGEPARIQWGRIFTLVCPDETLS